MALLFENAPCSRCGGSGKFSWCQQYGDTCFKCHGEGATLTKRGRAAQIFLAGLRCRPANTIRIGDVIHCEIWYPGGTKSFFAPVTEISPATCYADDETNDSHVSIRATSAGGTGMTQVVGRDAAMRIAFSKADKRQHRAEALEYQKTLTKAGTPRKRALVNS